MSYSPATQLPQTANTVYAGPTSGGASPAGFRALVSTDIPALPYDIQGSMLVVPAATIVLLFPCVRAFTLGSTAAEFVFRALTGAVLTATTFTLEKVASGGGTTVIGSVTFPAGGTLTPTFTVTTPGVTFAVGDYLKMTTGGSVDGTIANVGYAFKATA